MTRFIYELARDHNTDTDTTADTDWHLVRLDDKEDPTHIHTLCDRTLEQPLEHWNVDSLKSLETLVCQQCQVRHEAETGREAV